MTNNLYFQNPSCGINSIMPLPSKSLSKSTLVEGTFEAKYEPHQVPNLSTGKNAYSPFTTGKLIWQDYQKSYGNYSYSFKPKGPDCQQYSFYEASAGASNGCRRHWWHTSLMVGGKLYYGLKDNAYLLQSLNDNENCCFGNAQKYQ